MMQIHVLWPVFWMAIVVIAMAMKHRRRMLRMRLDHEARHTVAEPRLQDSAERREIEALRERIKVLERIAVDGNAPEAREARRIAEEIEALRDKQGA